MFRGRVAADPPSRKMIIMFTTSFLLVLFFRLKGEVRKLYIVL